MRGWGRTVDLSRVVSIAVLLMLSAGVQVSSGSFVRLDAPEPPHRSIYALLEDRGGFLWIGTQDGLGRYDGYEIRTFRHYPSDPSSLSNSSVHVLLEDRDGVLWVGTENGLNRAEEGSGSFERLDTQWEASGSRGWFHCGFEDSRGRIWFGLDQGLLRLHPRTGVWKQYRHDPSDPRTLALGAVVGIQEQQSGEVWVATSDLSTCSLSLYQEDRDGFQRYPVPTRGRFIYTFLIDSLDRFWLHPEWPVLPRQSSLGLPEGPSVWQEPGSPCPSPRASLESASGMLWFGCGDGVYRAPGRELEVRGQAVADSPGSWLGNTVRALAEDRTGTLWVGTQGGLFRFDPHAKRFLHLGSDPGDQGTLSAEAVSAVVEDRDGGFFVGTYGGGLNRVNASLQVVERYCANPDTKDICIGPVIWDLHLDSHEVLWIAGDELWSLDTGSGQLELHEIPEASPFGVTFIEREPGGNLLFLAGGDGVLYEFDKSSGDYRAHPKAAGQTPASEDARIDSLLWTPGRLWLGARNRLCSLQLDSEDLLCLSLDPPEGPGLRSQGTWALHPDGHGGIWLGTSVGLAHFEPQSGVWRHLTTAEGLPGSAVYSILEDDGGGLWLGTNQGLSVFASGASGEAMFRNYSRSDGLKNTELNRHAALRASDGRFLFGGMDGLTVFDPGEIRDNPVAPPVHITSIQVFSRDEVRPVEPRGLERLELNHRDSTFALEFTALSYTAPDRNQYAYRLEGFDEDWVEAGNRRNCQYTNIPPGEYVFRVKGSNNDEVWNEVGAGLDVWVRPAPWQTLWFKLAMALALTGLGLAAYGYRVAKRREMDRIRLRIAGDLHDELSSDLSAVAVVADVVQRKTYLEEEDRSDLKEIRESSLKMVDGVRDIVWFIDPEHDSMSSLVDRMRSVAETLLRGVEHRFLAKLEGGGALPMPLRRNLFLIYKEAIHNVVRHSGAQRVELEVTQSRNRFELVVADDGVGIRGQEIPGYGLTSMRRRAKDIGAQLNILSREGQGCQVRVVLDLASSRDSDPRELEGSLSTRKEGPWPW